MCQPEPRIRCFSVRRASWLLLALGLLACGDDDTASMADAATDSGRRDGNHVGMDAGRHVDAASGQTRIDAGHWMERPPGEFNQTCADRGLVGPTFGVVLAAPGSGRNLEISELGRFDAAEGPAA